jgi:hypothetical protein
MIPLVFMAAACGKAADDPAAPNLGTVALAKAPPPPPEPMTTVKLPTNTAGLSVRSDGLYIDGTFSLYANGVCGVTASILTNGSGDAIMQTNNPKAPDRRCVNAPRTWTLAYDDGFVETIPVFINLHEIQSSAYAIPVGATVKRRFGINPTQVTRCDRLVWGDEGDSVLVTRSATNTWDVRSQDAPSDQAWCSTTGVRHHMPIRFVITTP